MPTADNRPLTLALTRSLRVCRCGHVVAIHKKGADRQACYTSGCGCAAFVPRMAVVRDQDGETVARIRSEDFGVTQQQLQLLKYVWAGLTLTPREDSPLTDGASSSAIID